MPLAPNTDSDCGKLPYFSREGWNSREKGKAGKGGPQSENVGLQFAEDMNGQAVPYVVAKEMRAMLNSLFHSLLANGQAAEVSNSLTHEARVYIHVTMSNHFPLLLFCEGGRWKIDLMITQAYSGFWTNHGHKAIKKEPANGSLEGLPSAVVKREWNPNDADTEHADEGPRKKKARVAKSTLASTPVGTSSAPALPPPPLHAHTTTTTTIISSPPQDTTTFKSTALALSMHAPTAVTTPRTTEQTTLVDAALPQKEAVAIAEKTTPVLLDIISSNKNPHALQLATTDPSPALPATDLEAIVPHPIVASSTEAGPTEVPAPAPHKVCAM